MVGSSGRSNIHPIHRSALKLRSSEWRREPRSSTHYLLLLAVGREALGQQGTVLQQDFGDGLGGGKNRRSYWNPERTAGNQLKSVLGIE